MIKIALCCIGRLENNYAVEFVEFYKSIGVDKIFIYDNNYDGEEYFEEVLQEYVDSGFVDITDFRNMSICQLNAYQDCYDKHGNEYDWICFFDFDEFIAFEKEDNLKNLLSYDIYKDYDVIHVNWLCYGDNGNVKYENKPVIERFKNPISPLNFTKNLRIPENYHIKSIVRGGLNSVIWKNTPHTPSNDLKCCDAAGNTRISTSPFVGPFAYKNMCLRHYLTKTIEEYYTTKVKRGFPDGHKFFFEENSWVEEFFKINERTKEKYDYIEEVNGTNLDMFIGTYKTFTPVVKNPVYKIIYGNHNLIENNCLRYIKCVSDEPLDDRFYSEFYMLKNLPKDYKLAKYVGFCHYRKYFNFFDEIPNLDELFKEYDAIMTPLSDFSGNGSVRDQYAKYHNVEDLDIVGDIIKNKFPDYYEPFEEFINGSKMRYLNMFIMRREDFKKYIEFIDGILSEYIKIVGTDIYKRINDNKEKYLKDYSPNDSIEYQYRIGGYLIERLINVFAKINFKNIKSCGVKITEYKY